MKDFYRKLFIHYLDEFLVTLIPEGKMAECVHAINKYFDRLYTGNPARAVNELYGLKINNPVINGLIEKLVKPLSHKAISFEKV